MRRPARKLWRFYTIPGPGEPGNETWSGDSWKTGGAAVWNSGAYDADANLVYFGTGNPWPDRDGSVRLGDNLYSDSVVALDPDTGKLKWHYQFTPHDQMDYDSTQVPILADIAVAGASPQGDAVGEPQRRRVRAGPRHRRVSVRQAVREGELDGRLRQERAGRSACPARSRRREGELIMPTVLGATNWAPASFSPRTGLFYVSVWENTGTIAVSGGGRGPQRGVAGTGGTPMGQAMLTPNLKKEEEGFGAVRAFDPHTLEKKWEFKMNDITWAGVLTTASDLLFSGGKEGYFFALDARSGELLWKIALGGQVNSGPMTYSVNGRQYVTIAAGNSLFAFALRQ